MDRKGKKSVSTIHDFSISDVLKYARCCCDDAMRSKNTMPAAWDYSNFAINQYTLLLAKGYRKKT